MQGPSTYTGTKKVVCSGNQIHQFKADKPVEAEGTDDLLASTGENFRF